MKNEIEILKRLSEDDQESFKYIFSSFYSKVRTFAYGFLKDYDEADDVTQMIFIKVWEKRKLFVAVNNFDSYLFSLSKRTIYNYIESKHIINIPIDEADDPFFEDTPYEQLIAKDLSLLIDMVVDSMPPQRRTIYRMSRIEGLSNDEISEKLGLQKKTVENHLNLALKELRNVISVLILVLMSVLD